MPGSESNDNGVQERADHVRAPKKRRGITIGEKKAIIQEALRRPNERSTIADERGIDIESLYSILANKDAIMKSPADDDGRMRLRPAQPRKKREEHLPRKPRKKSEYPALLAELRQWILAQPGLVSGVDVKNRALVVLESFASKKSAAQRQAARRLVQELGVQGKSTMFKGLTVPALPEVWEQYAENTSNVAGAWWASQRVRLTTFDCHRHDVDCAANAADRIECPPQGCDAGAGACTNSAITSGRALPAVCVVETPQCGYGLRLEEAVGQGSKIIEYVGELILGDEYERRRSAQAGTGNFYFGALFNQRTKSKKVVKGSLYVDGFVKGNLSRFANHSCRPTCAFEVWYVEGRPRLFIVALSDLKQGSPVTMKYMDKSWGIECLCGFCDGLMCLKKA